MNWKRGLFRLWVLASVIWIVGAGTWLRADTFLAEYVAKTSDRLSITAVPDGPWLNYRQEYVKFTPPQRVALAKARQRRAQAELLSVASILLLPSLAAFAIGAAGVWVSRGFRGTPK